MAVMPPVTVISAFAMLFAMMQVSSAVSVLG
jgi:hypothetical protein